MNKIIQKIQKIQKIQIKKIYYPNLLKAMIIHYKNRLFLKENNICPYCHAMETTRRNIDGWER